MRLKMFCFLLGVTVASSCVVGMYARGPLTTRASQSSHSRTVRVVTVSEDGFHVGTSDLLEPVIRRLDQAASSFHPDIACLPELFNTEYRQAESVPGPTTRRLAMWARKYSSYIVFGLKTKRDGKVYNSAILIDRQGKIVGTYDKMHPTEGEIKEGRTPGEEDHPPVFKTDFGIIGIQICFDVNWRNDWRRLKQEGAQIVFWPSAYPAARQMPTLAMLNQFFVVSCSRSGSSHIYDITGRTLASSGKYQEWAGAALPLGERLFETDYNAAKVPEIEDRYGSKIKMHWYHASGWFTLASLDPNLTVQMLITQYHLVPLNDYIKQSEREIHMALGTGKKDAATSER